VSTQPKTFLTEEQYLELERKAEYKSEYLNGEMFAMAGAREAHNLLIANLMFELMGQLRPRRCRVYPSEMRVRVTPGGLYTYPDVTALCSEPRFTDEQRDTLLNPQLIIEVLSPSTEAYDRGRKFDMYKALESLREYVLVASDRVHVDLYSRQSDGRWLLSSADQPADSLAIESVGAQLGLSSVYENVDLPS
jgi:Uma2 family endonuclease